MNESELAEHITNHSDSYKCAGCGKDEWHVNLLKAQPIGKRFNVRCRHCGREEQL